MNIALFGAPGAGKGTQSTLLEERLGFVQISTGDLFRAAMKNKTPLGVKAQEYVNRGDLVPDAITVEMVAEALEKNRGKQIILDGFPRNTPQAETLEKMMVERGFSLESAVFLEVPDSILVARLTGRRICQGCNAIFHIITKPSKKEGICDECGGSVVQRKDDNESVITNRLMTYQKGTLPLKEFYKTRGKFHGIDGNRDTEIVFNEIRELLDNR